MPWVRVGKGQNQGKTSRAPGQAPQPPNLSPITTKAQETQTPSRMGLLAFPIALVSEDLSQGSIWCSPVIVLEPGPPVGGPQERLHSTGQIHKQVTHQKEPVSWGLVGTERPPWQLGT